MLFDPRARVHWTISVFVASLIIGLYALGPPTPHPPGSCDAPRDPSMPGSCTILSVTKGDSVFFGNNEDWRNPNTFVWVEPPGSGKYGVLCLGFDDLGPQGGINEKGLAFDGNALPYIPIKTHSDRLQPKEAIVNKMIMHNCATVEEAIAIHLDVQQQ